MPAKDHRELRVYQLAFESAVRVYELTKAFPAEERYSLTDQIRRSSRSVCANIAEAWRLATLVDSLSPSVLEAHLAQLVVVERLPGTATTDFGAPGVAPTVDHDRSCDAATIRRFEKILRAGWRAFDQAARSARGKTLATGPRGGGRSLEAIVGHVIGADAGYLTAVGWKAPKAANPAEQLTATREAILAALRASAAGEIPSRGPRGGARWSARLFVRRVAWHVMAHVWEIERRAARSPQ